MRESLVDGRPIERLLVIVGAVRSGLVDALADGEARPAAEVAGSAGADARATTIVLEALAEEGIVERVVERVAERAGEAGEAFYRLSVLGRAHLVDKGPDFERWGLLHQANKVRGWLELSEVIRTGEPALKGIPQRDVRTRSMAMGEREPDVLDELAERCFAYAGSIGSMIDVGGAVGHLARCFSRRGVRSTLFDKEEVILLARDFLGDETGGIELVAGDYTVELPKGPFDLMYFGNVYHIYGPETNAAVTQEAFGSVPPGGTIAIQDYVWGRGPEAAMFAVNMLRSTVDGGVWTEGQHREWLSGAGFVDIEIADLHTAPTQLILARRP